MKGNNIGCDLAASTGVHDYTGVVKQILAGADAVQLCSALFQKGIPYIQTILEEMTKWMEKHRFETIADFKGKSLKNQTMDASFERIQFMKRDYE
jgi:dihydroorotate dehydrogenase (fumarate)